MTAQTSVVIFEGFISLFFAGRIGHVVEEWTLGLFSCLITSVFVDAPCHESRYTIFTLRECFGRGFCGVYLGGLTMIIVSL